MAEGGIRLSKERIDLGLKMLEIVFVPDIDGKPLSPEALQVLREISEDLDRRAVRYLEEAAARRKQQPDQV